MSSAKPALKQQRETPQAPERLVFQKPFELFTALPMQECIVRLKFATQEKVYLHRITPTKIEFNFVQRGDVPGNVWAVGYIEEIDDTRTRVTGRTGLQYFDLYISLFIMAFGVCFCSIAGLPSPSGALFALMVGVPIFTLRTWLILRWSRYKLMEKLRSIETVEPHR